MLIEAIRIKNFRAINDVTIKPRSYTTLIGPNNCGKSSVLRAIEIFLNQITPTIEDWRFEHTEDPIEIEAIFSNLKDWEKNKPGVSGLVYEGNIRLRVIYTYNKEKNKVDSKYEAFKPEETITGWSDRWGDLSEEIKNVIVNCGITTGKEWTTKANREKARSYIRNNASHLVLYSEPKWSDDSISIAPALKQAIPQAILVPAVFDASDASSPASKTPYGQLLNRIIIPAIQASQEFLALTSAFEAIRAKMSGSSQLNEIQAVADQISTRISSVVNASVKLTVESPDVGKILNTTAGIRIDDGVETNVDHQGHGIQRALVFSLLEILAKTNAQIDGDESKRSTILLFEEPELFLHPHLMRRLKKVLQEIGGNEAWQVITTTHSPFFVNVDDDPLSLVICKKRYENKELEVKQLDADPFSESGANGEREALRAALDFHPTVCEVFFADKTVLVEGDSEVAILNYQKFLDECNIAPDQSDHCTIVSCGGKWTILPIARLLKKFGISFRVIHDDDRKGRSQEELDVLTGVDPYCVNKRILEIVEHKERIFIVEDTLEDLLWPSGKLPSSRDKPYQAWLRVGEISTRGLISEHSMLLTMVQFAFQW